MKLAGVGVIAAGLKPAMGAEQIGASTYPSVPAKKGKEKFNLGMASYTFRKFPTEQALAMTKRLGLKYISFKDFHMPLNSTPEQIQNTVAKVKEAGTYSLRVRRNLYEERSRCAAGI